MVAPTDAVWSSVGDRRMIEGDADVGVVNLVIAVHVDGVATDLWSFYGSADLVSFNLTTPWQIFRLVTVSIDNEIVIA